MIVIDRQGKVIKTGDWVTVNDELYRVVRIEWQRGSHYKLYLREIGTVGKGLKFHYTTAQAHAVERYND